MTPRRERARVASPGDRADTTSAPAQGAGVVSSPAIRGVGIAGAVAILAVAAWLRWPLLELGFTSDELANIMVGDAARIFGDPESGTNPPLLRLLFNVPFEDAATPVWGRGFSFVCSVLSVGAAYGVGRAAAGGHVGGGWLAAALVALHPVHMRYGAIFRIYAWWSLTMGLHLWAAGRVLQAAREGARAPRVAWAVAVGTAALLPWIHYLSVPVLLALGLAVLLEPGRRLFAAYVVAALGVLPLVPKVLHDTGRRVAPQGEQGLALLAKMFGLDLVPPPQAADLGARWLRATDPEAVFVWGPTMGLSLMGVVAWVALTAWRRPATAGLAAAASVGLGVGIAVLGRIQYVRDPTMVMAVTVMAPVLAAWGLGGRRVGWRLGASLLVLAWVFPELGPRLAYHRGRALEQDAPRAVLAHLAEGPERPVHVRPDHALWTLWFHATGQHARRARGGDACGAHRPCLVLEGVPWKGLREAVPPDDAGWFVDLDVGAPPPALPDRCRRDGSGHGWTVWACDAPPGPPPVPSAPPDAPEAPPP